MCGAQGSICTELVGRISEHSSALAAAVAAAAEVAARLHAAAAPCTQLGLCSACAWSLAQCLFLLNIHKQT